MEYTNFSNTDRKVSRLNFGAMGLNCAFGAFDEDEWGRPSRCAAWSAPTCRCSYAASPRGPKGWAKS